MYAHGDSKYTKKDKKDLFTYDKERLGSGYKNDYVVDDCSKFAAAVYYHYINNTILKNKSINEKDGLGIDLWTTGSKNFDNIYSGIGKVLLETKKFEINNIDEINKKDLEIEVGDLIYRKEKAHYEYADGKRVSKTDIPGHVEFCIGNDKYVGWGKIQNIYCFNKQFYKNDKGFYSNYQDDYNQPYTTIIRFKKDE